MPALPCIVGVSWSVPTARPMMRQLSHTSTSRKICALEAPITCAAITRCLRALMVLSRWS